MGAVVKILNEKKSTAGSPYVYYNVYVQEIDDTRTANSVDLNLQTITHLASASSSLGSGSGYTLTGYLKIEGVEYSIPIKGKNDAWSGTTNHTSAIKRITIPNLLPSQTTLENITFRVARGNGSTSSAGYLASTSCSNISISLGHDVPSDITMTMVETNASLTGVSNDVIVENLSQKQLTFNYTLHDNATLDKVGVYNVATPYSSASNPFTLDLSQVTLSKNENNKIPLTPYVKDSLGGQGLATTTEYTYIPYTNVSITDSTTNAKRLGQTSGRVGLNINGVFYNGVVGSTDQSSTYKPTIKYKYWKVGDSEPVSYTNTISSSDISISDNAFSVSSLDIGSSTETDPNYFDPEYAYRIKIQVNDTFTTIESNELQIQVGEAIWTEYKDRVDFKKLSIAGNLVNDYVIEEGGDYTTSNLYIKYASGILIQYGRIKVTSAISTALGSVYRTSNKVGITLIENFYDTNYVITTTANAAINAFYVDGSAKAVGSFDGYAIAYTSTSSATRYIDFIAIGRWKA